MVFPSVLQPCRSLGTANCSESTWPGELKRLTSWRSASLKSSEPGRMWRHLQGGNSRKSPHDALRTLPELHPAEVLL
eukprot:g3531.t1